MIERLSFEREMQDLELRKAAGAKLSPSSVIDPRIDVYAQYSLQRMIFKGNASVRSDGVKILSAIKAGWLGGIYKEDEGIPAKFAKDQNLGWWQLIPKGKDAALILSKFYGNKPPIIVFRNNIRSNHSRIDSALRDAWADFRDVIERCGGKNIDIGLLDKRYVIDTEKLKEFELVLGKCKLSKSIVELRAPPCVAQKNSWTCWAAALESLYYATLPDTDLVKIQSPKYFSEENNIRRVMIAQSFSIPSEKFSEKNTSKKLLNNDNSLYTIHPGPKEVEYVFTEVFDLGWIGNIPSSCTNVFWDILERQLRQDCYAILTYCPTKWQPKNARWSWHSVVVYGIVVCEGRKRLKVMNPDGGSYVYLDLDPCEKSKDPKEKDPRWHFICSFRNMQKSWSRSI